MKRHELSRRPVGAVVGVLPAAPAERGGQWKDDRAILNGIFRRLNTGAPWRDLPDRFGPWQTVYERFAALRRSGLLDRILEGLQLRLNDAGLIDPYLYCVDGTNVRAARAAAGAAKKKSPARRAGRPRPGVQPGRASGPRSTSSPTATGSAWPSGLTPGQAHESTSSRRSWTRSASPAGGAGPRAARCGWPGTRGTATRTSGAWLRRHGITGRDPAAQGPAAGRRAAPVRPGRRTGGGRWSSSASAGSRRAGRSAPGSTSSPSTSSPRSSWP